MAADCEVGTSVGRLSVKRCEKFKLYTDDGTYKENYSKMQLLQIILSIDTLHTAILRRLNCRNDSISVALVVHNY